MDIGAVVTIILSTTNKNNRNICRKFVELTIMYRKFGIELELVHLFKGWMENVCAVFSTVTCVQFHGLNNRIVSVILRRMSNPNFSAIFSMGVPFKATRLVVNLVCEIYKWNNFIGHVIANQHIFENMKIIGNRKI